jgi:hypothetical protein
VLSLQELAGPIICDLMCMTAADDELCDQHPSRNDEQQCSKEDVG